MLFVLQNVFNQEVYKYTWYKLSPTVIEHLQNAEIPVKDLAPISNESVAGGKQFRTLLRQHVDLAEAQEELVIGSAELFPMQIQNDVLESMQVSNNDYLSEDQMAALQALRGDFFEHKWQLKEALIEQTSDWKSIPATKINKKHNNHLKAQLNSVYEAFKSQKEGAD